MVFPELVEPRFRLDTIDAALETDRLGTDGACATFVLSAAGQRAHVSLPLRRESSLPDVFAQLPGCAQLLVCKLAFCMAFGEPALLRGPTCFKAHCVRLLASHLAFEQSSPLNAVFLSPLTEKSDLEGSIEPHNLQSFVHYIQGCCSWLNDQAAAQSPAAARADVPSFGLDGAIGSHADVRSCLEWHAAAGATATLDYNRRSGARWAAMLLEELRAFEATAQGFPFCERGVARSVRFGGMLFLKGFDLPDQAAVEGLNGLTELERTFSSGADPDEGVPVHAQLHIVASVHEAACADSGRGSTVRGLSPAVVSRFTLIHVEPPRFVDFGEAYRGLLERRLGYPGCARGVDYMLAALGRLEQLQPRLVHRLTLRNLLQWCDYAGVQRRAMPEPWERVPGATQLLNLVLGGQVLLLDKLPPEQRAEAALALGEVESSLEALL